MANPYFNIYHFPSPARSDPGSYLISDVTKLGEDEGVNTKSGKFRFTIDNAAGKNAGSFVYGDNVKIEAGYGSDSPTVLMFGIVEGTRYRLSSNSRTVELVGMDYSRKLMDYFVQFRYRSGASINWGEGDDSDITSGKVVKHIVREFVARDSIGDDIGYSTYVDPGSETQSWYHTLGSEFNLTYMNKRANEVINEIRTGDFTGVGNFVFYIDRDKELHFERKTSVSSSTELEEGVNIISINMEQSIANRYTAFMVKAGEDVTGDGIYCAGGNRTAINQYGFKWGYATHTEIYDNIYKQWSGLKTNAEIYDEAKRQGTVKAKQLALEEGMPRWEGDAIIKGNTEFTAGSNVNVTIKVPSFGWDDGKELRLEEVSHDWTNRGWFTTLALKENVGVL